MSGLNVGVVVDWRHRSRGNFWPDVLGHPPAADVVDPEYRYLECRVADQIGASAKVAQPSIDGEKEPGSEDNRTSFFAALKDLHVLIINWDAINGDPEFGADLTFRWIEHHRRELWHWVASKGGLLILEGQAVLDEPDQRAYDALFGRHEVIVCGPEDDLDPSQQRVRCGQEGRVARRARNRGSVGAGLVRLGTTKKRSYEEMFPGEKHHPLLENRDWDLLYRGWFERPSIWRRSKLPWCVIATTRPRPFRRSKPICLAARHGSGAFIATTMLLASSEQRQLVTQILAGVGSASGIPARPNFVTSAAEKMIPSVVTAGVVYAVASRAGASPEARFAATAVGVFIGVMITMFLAPMLGSLIRKRRRARRR